MDIKTPLGWLYFSLYVTISWTLSVAFSELQVYLNSIVKLCTPNVVQHRVLGRGSNLELNGIWIILTNRTLKCEHDVGALWHWFVHLLMLSTSEFLANEFADLVLSITLSRLDVLSDAYHTPTFCPYEDAPARASLYWSSTYIFLLFVKD